MLNISLKINNFYIPPIILLLFNSSFLYGKEQAQSNGTIYSFQIEKDDSYGNLFIKDSVNFKDGGAFFSQQPTESLKKLEGKEIPFCCAGKNDVSGVLVIENVQNPNQIKIQKFKEDEPFAENKTVFLMNVGPEFKGAYYKIYSDELIVNAIDPKKNTAILVAQNPYVIEYDINKKNVTSMPSTQEDYIKALHSSQIASHDAVLVSDDNVAAHFVVSVLPTSTINNAHNLELVVQFLPKEVQGNAVQKRLLPTTWAPGVSLKKASVFIDHYTPHHWNG
jgi:hypothetical protein